MRLIRALSTVRGLSIAIALIALNIAAAIRTSRDYPRPVVHPDMMIGNGRGFSIYHADGSVDVGVGNAETGWHLTKKAAIPPRKTLLAIWAPVIGATSLTILVAAFAMRKQPSRGVARV